jgi:hypothetical protein
MDDTFFDLLRRNVAGLVENFWAAGYVDVIAGSFLRPLLRLRVFPPAASALGGIPPMLTTDTSASRWPVSGSPSPYGAAGCLGPGDG